MSRWSDNKSFEISRKGNVQVEIYNNNGAN